VVRSGVDPVVWRIVIADPIGSGGEEFQGSSVNPKWGMFEPKEAGLKPTEDVRGSTVNVAPDNMG